MKLYIGGVAAVAGFLIASATLHNPSLKCTQGHPCLSITFNPSSASVKDDASLLTFLAAIIVTTIPSGINYTLGFGSPYGSDNGICAIQGTQLLLGAQLPSGDSTQMCTITATPL